MQTCAYDSCLLCRCCQCWHSSVHHCEELRLECILHGIVDCLWNGNSAAGPYGKFEVVRPKRGQGEVCIRRQGHEGVWHLVMHITHSASGVDVIDHRSRLLDTLTAMSSLIIAALLAASGPYSSCTLSITHVRAICCCTRFSQSSLVVYSLGLLL